MGKEKEAPAKASTPKRHHKDSEINSYIIEILISICVFAIGYLFGFFLGGII